MSNIIDFILGLLPKLFTLAVIIGGGIAATFGVRIGIKKTIGAKNESAGNIIAKVVVTAIWAILIFASLGVFGVNIGSLATLIGAVSVALSLALKDLLGNLASGIIMLWTKPFAIGDIITVAGSNGKVVKIDLLYTQLELKSGTEIYVPNGVISGSAVTINR